MQTQELFAKLLHDAAVGSLNGMKTFFQEKSPYLSTAPARTDALSIKKGQCRMLLQNTLLWVATILSSGIWLMVGLYQLTHFAKVTETLRAHRIPFAKPSLVLAIVVELSGAILMITMTEIWIAALMWLIFIVVSTPVFHGRIVSNSQINYQNFIHIGKNLSIAGGLIGLIVIDGTIPEYFATLQQAG